MKKKIVSALLLVVLALQLVACGSKDCKYDGCDAETYKKGYCEMHYVIKYPNEALGDLLDF